MKEIEEVKALGENVVLKIEIVEAEEKKTSTGLIKPGKEAKSGQVVNTPQHNGKVTANFYVHSIGKLVPADAEIKVGDMAIINEYDGQTFTDGRGEDGMYVVCHWKNVKVALTPKA